MEQLRNRCKHPRAELEANDAAAASAAAQTATGEHARPVAAGAAVLAERAACEDMASRPIAEIRRLAETRDDPIALAVLAQITTHGTNGVRPDPQRAIELYRRCVGRVLSAGTNLGMLLRARNARGDVAEARRLFVRGTAASGMEADTESPQTASGPRTSAGPISCLFTVESAQVCLVRCWAGIQAALDAEKTIWRRFLIWRFMRAPPPLHDAHAAPAPARTSSVRSAAPIRRREGRRAARAAHLAATSRIRLLLRDLYQQPPHPPAPALPQRPRPSSPALASPPLLPRKAPRRGRSRESA